MPPKNFRRNRKQSGAVAPGAFHDRGCFGLSNGGVAGPLLNQFCPTCRDDEANCRGPRSGFLRVCAPFLTDILSGTAGVKSGLQIAAWSKVPPLTFQGDRGLYLY